MDTLNNLGFSIRTRGRHLSMNNSLSSCHELQITLVKSTLATNEVLMINRTINDVCDSLLASMRMVWETSGRGDLEMVKKKERREVSNLHVANGSSNSSSNSLRLLNGSELSGYFSGCKRHRLCCLCVCFRLNVQNETDIPMELLREGFIYFFDPYKQPCAVRFLRI